MRILSPRRRTFLEHNSESTSTIDHVITLLTYLFSGLAVPRLPEDLVDLFFFIIPYSIG